MKLTELDYLTDDVKELTLSLDELSKIFKQVEDIIDKENKFKLEFTYHADVIEGIFISWKRLSNSRKKRCRLYIKWVERDYERPIAELPTEFRVECAKYLFPFLGAFREFIREKTETMQDAVVKLKADMECY